jgi:hypothetical protein
VGCCCGGIGASWDWERWDIIEVFFFLGFMESDMCLVFLRRVLLAQCELGFIVGGTV